MGFNSHFDQSVQLPSILYREGEEYITQVQRCQSVMTHILSY